jgi:hypothetical protein
MGIAEIPSQLRLEVLDALPQPAPAVDHACHASRVGAGWRLSPRMER